jgi:hypothetical protein
MGGVAGAHSQSPPGLADGGAVLEGSAQQISGRCWTAMAAQSKSDATRAIAMRSFTIQRRT